MLPGLKAALNYHPMFVHFPIVLWLAALLFELLAVWRASDEMQRTASRLLYLGTLAAIVTIFTGLAAQHSIPPGDAQRSARRRPASRKPLESSAHTAADAAAIASPSATRTS